MLWVEYLWLQWSKVGHVDVHKEVNVVLRILAEDKKDVGHVEIIFDGGYLKKKPTYIVSGLAHVCAYQNTWPQMNSDIFHFDSLLINAVLIKAVQHIPRIVEEFGKTG